MSNYIEVLVIIVFLLVCSYYDIKERVVYTNICVVFFILAIIVELLLGDKGILVILYGILPAIFIFIVSIISNESIGKGDAFIFLIVGIMFGCVDTLIIFVMALLIIVMYSIPLIVFKHNSIKTSLPFSPFVLTSFIVFSLF